MTQHLHSTFVEGCYRCDLSRDEMTADVNVTEKVARAMWASWNPHGPRWHQTDDRSREEARSEARKALGVLADPDVLAGIARVLRDAEDEWVRRYADAEGAPPTRSELQAAAVVEWLRRQA